MTITSTTEETIEIKMNFLKKVSLFSKNEKSKNKIINFIIYNKNMFVTENTSLLDY